MFKAVVFDLDDTLFVEEDYVKSGFRAVARFLGNLALYDKMLELYYENKKDVYQRMNFTEQQCNDCITVYRDHFPDLVLDNDVKFVLDYLKKNDYKTGIITDGRPKGQRNKINALGLEDMVDYIIITDELGGVSFRKPFPKAFELMKEKMSVEYEEMIYIGDNPQKDFFVRKFYPIFTVRLINTSGIYFDEHYYKDIKENMRISSLLEVLTLL